MGSSAYLIYGLEKIIAKSNENSTSPQQTAVLILEFIESLKPDEKNELISSMGGARTKIDKVARKYANLIGCHHDEIIKFLRDQECSLTADQINWLCSSNKYFHHLENKNETHRSSNNPI